VTARWIDERHPDYEAYLERVAEARAEAREEREMEPLDRWGRDADWHFPRGYGGLA
jgi:hypothetical protein